MINHEEISFVQSMAPKKSSAVAKVNRRQLSAQPVSSLWAQLSQRLPELRNAAQYYVHDVHRIGKLVVHAAGAVAESLNVPAPEGRGDGRPPDDVCLPSLADRLRNSVSNVAAAVTTPVADGDAEVH